VMRMSVKGGTAAESAGDAAKNNVLQANGFEPGAENIPANIMAQANSAAAQATQTANMTLNNKITCFNSCMTGSNNILGSIGQFIASQYDAKLKEQEGNVERIRATQQQLESLDEALKSLIQKAISSQDAIQQNINQTRTRILG
ncbi:MAG: type III secretion system protein, partial [Desulfovibrionaceae bacterium]|nr:type III secretion system protein [Desulfovibrionaceae bacterium]